MNVIECYTATDHALKYSLIRLEAKVRFTAMMKAIGILKIKYDFCIQEIFGYAPVASTDLKCDDPIEQHVAYQVIVQHMNDAHEKFEWFIAEGCKKSLLSKHSTFQSALPINVDSMSKDQLKKTLLEVYEELQSVIRQKRSLQDMYMKERSQRSRIEG